MGVKEQFVQDLVDKLYSANRNAITYGYETPIKDVSYMVSVVDQQIEKYKEFIEDISKHTYCIDGYDEDITEGYTNGKIRILIEKPDEEKESEYMVDAYYDYCYFIEFLFDRRHWGYCQCDPDDEGYNPKYKCCGNGCDWDAPAFRLTKEIDLGYSSWDGSESDFWKYKENFLLKEQNKNNEVEKLKITQEKQYLEKEIERLQQKLISLNN